jgi:GNAT superfamily N-acetyltransferase
MRIRRATDDDAGAVVDLYLRARRASIPAIPPGVHTDDEVRTHFAVTVLPGRETWVAEDDGAIVGMLVLDGSWVDHLYVDPGSTGRGVGTELLDHAKACRRDGLDLWAFQSNAGARRFYERHGFVAVAETDGDNEEGAPDVRYRWDR